MTVTVTLPSTPVAVTAPPAAADEEATDGNEAEDEMALVTAAFAAPKTADDEAEVEAEVVLAAAFVGVGKGVELPLAPKTSEDRISANPVVLADRVGEVEVPATPVEEKMLRRLLMSLLLSLIAATGEAEGEEEDLGVLRLMGVVEEDWDWDAAALTAGVVKDAEVSVADTVSAEAEAEAASVGVWVTVTRTVVANCSSPP